MPRRVVSIRRRSEIRGLTTQWVEYLFTGNLMVEAQDFPAPGDDAARSTWGSHRVQLLHWWLRGIPADAFRQTHFGFGVCERAHPGGTRPWAWWRFDAPARRRLLAVWDMVPRSGTCYQDFIERDPTAEDEGRAWNNNEELFGLPRFGGPYRFETEAEFLERNGLLIDGEHVG